MRSLVWASVVALASCRSSVRIDTYRDAPIIVISIDTLRADRLPIYGYRSGSTPQLDQFARDAIVFDNLYSHTPLTLPSHASLLTGQLPTHHGVRDNVGYTLGPDARTLATRFKAAGYATGAAVSSYVLRHQTGIAGGFDFFDDAIEIAGTGESLSDNQRDGRISVDALADWIDRQSSSRLFALLHLYEPHTPYAPPASHQRSNPYDGEIAYADELVGRLLARLKARGLLERAIVAVVSDHGEGLGDHGETEHGILLYREALHVPGILRLPVAPRVATTSRARSASSTSRPRCWMWPDWTPPVSMAGPPERTSKKPAQPAIATSTRNRCTGGCTSAGAISPPSPVER
jgi:hypothetical protein